MITQTRPNIFIVVLNFNSSQDTIECLKSISQQENPGWSVLVVDNGSEPADFEAVKEFIQFRSETSGARLMGQDLKLRLIRNEQNLGYAGGNNVGIRYALEQGADYVLILNPDSRLSPDFVDRMASAAQRNPAAGIIGPIVDEGRGRIAGGRITWLRSQLKHVKPGQKFDYIPGNGMLIKNSVFQKIGFFNERYFLYFEDADFSFRARQAGFALAIVDKTELKHKVSASTSKLGSALLLRYHFRNSHLFNWKNGPFGIKALLPFWSALVIIKQIIKIIFFPAKRQISRAILSGVIDFYRASFGKIDP